jgi:hypothetical protein
MPPTAEEVLAQHASDYQNAPRSNRWQPPDGDYIDAIKNVEFAFFGKGNPGCQVYCEIIDGEYAGRQHSVGIFTLKNLGMLADLVEILGGPDDITDAAAAGNWIKQNRLGAPVRVEVKTGPKYTNANIVELLEADEAPEEPTEPPADE